MHNNIMAAGSKDRPPMLGPGRYSQWRSRFLRYIDTKPNGEILRDRFIRRDSDEYNTYLVEQHSELLQQLNTSFKSLDKFLEDEIDSMKKTTDQIQTSFQALMEKKLGGIVDIVMNKFVDKIFTHLDIVTRTVMADRFGGYHPELGHLITNATTSVISNTKEKYSSQLLEMIECEKKTVYSVDTSYVVSFNKLKANHTRFSEAMRKQSMTMEIEGVGKADLKHLQKIADEERNQAFELKMKSTAYINVVIKRVVDGAALQLRSMIENFVTGEMVTEIVNTIISRGDDDIDHLFQTSPSVNADREKIENNIALLLETKKNIIKVMDSIPHY
ncbi:dynamin-related protein 4C-like protein [Tanacetum coccineum]